MELISKILLLLSIPLLFRLDTFQVRTNDAVLLGGKNGYVSVGQSFTAKHDNLNQIKIHVNNSTLKYKLPVYFVIKENPKGNNVLARLNFSGENIGTDYWLPIKFAPIPNTKGKTLYFELSTPKSLDIGIEVRRSKEDFYSFGNVFLNQTTASGDLGFKIYYKVGVLDFFRDSLSDFYTKAVSDKTFFTFYFGMLSALVLVFFYVLKKK